MAGRGGYQAPASPAPVSGPGKLSQRTDRGQKMRVLPDAAYGEQATFQADQAGAPMAAAGGAPQSSGSTPPDLSQVVGFGDPTQRPNEPVTSGAPTGPGPGMDALGLANPQSDSGMQYIRDVLPMRELASQLPSAGPAFRQFVRRIRGSA